MTMTLGEIFRRAKGREPIELPRGMTKEENREIRRRFLVSDMAIDPRYVSISYADLESYQYQNLPHFWKGEKKQARQILEFNPEEDERGWYLHGAPGAGKTSILKALAIRLAKRYPGEVKFTQMKHALDAMAQNDFALKEFIKRDLVNVRFLFIDDLGVERASEWVSEQIYSILDLRLYAATPAGKPKVTFFSSNLTADEFSNRYHGRSVRRIRELAEFLEVK